MWITLLLSSTEAYDSPLALPPSLPETSVFVLVVDTEVWIWGKFWLLFPLYPPSLSSTMPKLCQRDEIFTPFLELSMSLAKLLTFLARKHFL